MIYAWYISGHGRRVVVTEGAKYGYREVCSNESSESFSSRRFKVCDLNRFIVFDPLEGGRCPSGLGRISC